MKKFRFLICVVLSACVVAFLVVAPSRLLPSLDRNIYREWLEPEREDWRGVITLWHIVDFKTYQGSVTSFLTQCADAYEQDHPGVYFEVTGMDLADFHERVANGQRPDVYSFPLGALYEEQLAPLDASFDLLPGLVTIGNTNASYAVPYLYSGYFLLGNSILLQEGGIDWPKEDVQLSWLQELIDSSKDAKVPALSAPNVLSAKLGLTGTLAEYAQFVAGRVPVAIADARACGDLARKLNNDGFTFEALPFPAYSEQAQLIGVAKDTDAQRKAHALAFIEMLLSEPCQSKLTALGALPVTNGLSDITYADDTLQRFYEAYQSPSIPNAFLYQRYQDQLREEAARALTGDAQAKQSLDTRFNELLSASANIRPAETGNP